MIKSDVVVCCSVYSILKLFLVCLNLDPIQIQRLGRETTVHLFGIYDVYF